jgi:hypothetical protein
MVCRAVDMFMPREKRVTRRIAASPASEFLKDPTEIPKVSSRLYQYEKGFYSVSEAGKEAKFRLHSGVRLPGNLVEWCLDRLGNPSPSEDFSD